ncbi:MAG: hypothetical protein F4X83_00160 [Chloroflexi bacterium]|nr:hypothetical protein [Chloroflexota bacterium]
MSRELNMLEAITAGKRLTKRFEHLMHAVISGSDTKACLAIRRNRFWLRRLARKRYRRLRRQVADPPAGTSRDDVKNDISDTAMAIRSLEPFYLVRAREVLTRPVRCRI